MGRTLLLVLCILPTAAWAGTISFTASSEMNAIGVPFSVVVPGSIYTIEMFGDATLVAQDTWDLTGYVTVLNSKTNATIFKDTLTGSGSTFFGFDGGGTLDSNSTVRGGSYQFGVDPEGNGEASVSVNIPEPRALGLLGIGFLGIGLSGWKYRCLV